MKEINISRTLVHKRREKGITQDELAFYLGVSKASVSKWETGQSYPDITLLPQLAAYFNISIDELLSYSPQMTKEDIRRLYYRLAADFARRPFGGVYAECRTLIKKYYSCFPLLLQMVILLMNHHMLAPEKETREEVLALAAELCLRIKAEGGDTRLSERANQLHAACLLMQNRPAEAAELLEGRDGPSYGDDGGLLANAYLAMGNLSRAKEVLQSGIYGKVMSILNASPMLISIHGQDVEKADLVIDRMLGLAELFRVEDLQPNAVLLLCLSAAQSCLMRGETDRALRYLARYADVGCSMSHPLTLHGDEFFDGIDGWIKDLDLGATAPREASVIKESLLQGVAANPAFAALADHPRYRGIVERLKSNAGGDCSE